MGEGGGLALTFLFAALSSVGWSCRSWLGVRALARLRVIVDEPVEAERHVVDLHRAVAGTVRREVGAVAAVVLAMADDDRLLPLLEHARAVCLVLEGGR